MGRLDKIPSVIRGTDVPYGMNAELTREFCKDNVLVFNSLTFVNCRYLLKELVA